MLLGPGAREATETLAIAQGFNQLQGAHAIMDDFFSANSLFREGWKRR